MIVFAEFCNYQRFDAGHVERSPRYGKLYRCAKTRVGDVLARVIMTSSSDDIIHARPALDPASTPSIHIEITEAPLCAERSV